MHRHQTKEKKRIIREMTDSIIYSSAPNNVNSVFKFHSYSIHTIIKYTYTDICTQKNGETQKPETFDKHFGMRTG